MAQTHPETSKKSPSFGTRTRYLARAEALIARFEATHGTPWAEAKSAFRRWANEELAPTLSANSIRQYRAALAYYYQESSEADESEAPDLRPAEDPGQDKVGARQKERRPKSTATSAQRKKGIKEKHYYALLADLARQRAVFAHMAGAMLVASRTFGLRPSEWAKAAWNTRESLWKPGNRYALVVQNAKHDEQRAFGPTRTLWFDPAQLEQHEIEAARKAMYDTRDYLDYRHAQGGTSPDESINLLLVGMGKVLAKARKRCGIRDQITLYSARHQFAADAKAAGLTLEEIAALMGHASTQTATTHYGRRTQGWGGGGSGGSGSGGGGGGPALDEDGILSDAARAFRVQPDPEDVLAVQARNTQTMAPIEVPLWAPKR